MTTLMTLKPPLEMPLLKFPSQQLGASKQRNRNFVPSWHVDETAYNYFKEKNRVSQALRMRTENSGRASIASNRREKLFQRPHS